tara:strand:+ start:858 stop:1244 length:387 start_codon:yes stop_codon:yes gene_type:complete
MATITTKLTLTSTDLLSQSLNLSLSKAITASHTTGLARAPITSTAIGTTSGQVTLYTADDYAAIAYLYIKNTDTTATDYIYVYTGSNIWLKLGGGEFAFLPMVADDTLKAYATTTGTIVEWMVFGTDQ